MKKRFVTIKPEIFELFPETQIGVVTVRQANNRGVRPNLPPMLRAEEAQVRLLFSAMKVPEHPVIQSWRKAYTQFGGSSNYRSSIEAIVKRVQKGDEIPTINPLVDCYNLISLKYVMPVGGEDLNAVSGDVHLAVATGSERFTPLGSEAQESPRLGEVVWLDESREVLCRRWNWRESDKTKLTPQTMETLLVVEGIPPHNAIDVKEAVCALEALVRTHCDAKTELFLLNQKVSRVMINF
jgi:DNA/RNA-binding domain of Phe-tRNA-synthetase-like protein